ncbi:MAG: HAMP domain-containing histidine kinase [Anaerolineae bacterium]|jgi:two-component system phosphate regulon sensor histidine kinase PhoR|nr:HAMP domain-containing histidine kinase [Anaerolineae bacterium]
MSALEQAKTELTQLIEAAKTGAIIPIRLPGQLEAIQELLQKAADEQASVKPALLGDAGTVRHENAEFFKTAIHELRTPMTSIRGYADMLSNPGMAGAMNEMQTQLLQVIRTNSKRMESLLTDMSFVNKIRAEILNVNLKMDMFKNIAMMVQKKVEPLAEELKRQVEFDIPSGLPILNTDGDLLSHALIKLIENGLRYSAEGEGKVTIRAEGKDNYLMVTIEDNGIGMTPEEMAKLGTLFFRSDHDAVRAFKGSGLGVPIAYGIIAGLGGTIEVSSEVGKGTKFILSLKGMS